MFARGYKESFEQWWLYYFLKNLYGLSEEEMKEYSDYKVSTPFIERAKNLSFMRATFVPPSDETDRNSAEYQRRIERGEEDGA